MLWKEGEQDYWEGGGFIGGSGGRRSSNILYFIGVNHTFITVAEATSNQNNIC